MMYVPGCERDARPRPRRVLAEALRDRVGFYFFPSRRQAVVTQGIVIVTDRRKVGGERRTVRS